jgi:predicted DNA-binding transcriptional regulator YafY
MSHAPRAYVPLERSRSEAARSAAGVVSRGPSRATRLARLRDQLKDRPRSVADLAAAEGMTRRTIERDLESLRTEMGEPVEVDAQRRYSIPATPTGLNDVEALATYSAARLLVHTGIGERHYRSSMLKLARQLPEPARGTLVRSVERLQTSPEDRVLDQVAQAWFQRRVLRCRYHSHGREDPPMRDLEIYFFELHRNNHEPYVFAYDRTERRKVLVLKLVRMTNVTLLDETYEVPDDFDPDEALAGSFGIVVGEEVSVTLRASPSAAPRIREMTNRGIVIEADMPDGGVVARLRGTLDDSGRALELVPWILGWGDDLEVLEPTSVREAVAEALRRAARIYQPQEAQVPSRP